MLAFAVPSSALTRERVAAIAALANLELDPLETDMFAHQLADILAYAEAIQRADTANVPPTSAVMEPANPEVSDRNDEVRPCLDLRDVLANAPDAPLDSGLFRVPRVIG
jgi:aspartyl-tRNA(Asn)/glutamyl-tRNA(Gln) amidotransferase subunit C